MHGLQFFFSGLINGNDDRLWKCMDCSFFFSPNANHCLTKKKKNCLVWLNLQIKHPDFFNRFNRYWKINLLNTTESFLIELSFLNANHFLITFFNHLKKKKKFITCHHYHEWDLKKKKKWFALGEKKKKWFAFKKRD